MSSSVASFLVEQFILVLFSQKDFITGFPVTDNDKTKSSMICLNEFNDEHQKEENFQK